MGVGNTASMNSECSEQVREQFLPCCKNNLSNAGCILNKWGFTHEGRAF